MPYIRHNAVCRMPYEICRTGARILSTIWNIALAPQAKSMKGILILFVDPADGGTAYSRDTEKFYNPKIKNVQITLDGNPNQLFAVA